MSIPSSIPARSQVRASIASSACGSVSTPSGHQQPEYFRLGPSTSPKNAGSTS